MLNRIVLIGRLVADPQLRYTQGGTAVTNFRIAVDRQFTNQQGERETDFIDIVTWRKLAEVVGQNLAKGRLVGVDGRLQMREYEYEGQRRRQAEVVADNVSFLDRPRDGDGRSVEDAVPVDADAVGEDTVGEDADDFNPDEVPF